MKTRLLEKLELIEKERKTLLEKLAGFDDEKLNEKPKPDKWSVLQVMNHLIKSEKLSVVYIKRKVNGNSDLKRTSFKSKINAFLLRIGLLLPLKLKAPANVSDLPDYDTFENVKANWDKTREMFLSIIIEMPDEMLEKDVFKHPSIGEMNIVGAVDFFDSHFKHHRKQIYSLLK